MNSGLKKIWNAVITALIVPILLLALVLVGGRLFGVQLYTVLSGSMEPEYPVGSLIWVKPTAASELAVGDVITFRLGNGTKGTHRIVDIDSSTASALKFQTKGDANEEADGWINASQIVGKAVFSVPYLGYAIVYIQSPPGLYVALSAAAGLLLLAILPEFIFSEKKSENHNREENHEQDQEASA
jgi:signal peptidase